MVRTTNSFLRIAHFLRAKEHIMNESLMALFFKEQQEQFALVTLLYSVMRAVRSQLLFCRER